LYARSLRHRQSNGGKLRRGCAAGAADVLPWSALDAEMKPLFVTLNTILLCEIPGGTQIDLHVCVRTRPDEARELKGCALRHLEFRETREFI
jgi:hypothetical protein